jgi:acyl-CoA thioesterase I
MIISEARSRSEADIVLVAPGEPDPAWEGNSGVLEEYRDVLSELSASHGAALADVTSAWRAARTAWPGVELLANGINHPNDLGHWIYARSLAEAVGPVG